MKHLHLMAAPAAPRVAALAAALATALLLSACSGAEKTPAAAPTAASPATPVGTARAALGPATRQLSFHGVIGSRDELKLSFKVGGMIRNVSVRPGEAVRRGQSLAELQLTEMDAQVTQAQELAERAARDLERGEHLYAEQVISLEQLQNLRTQSKVAAAQLSAVRFNHGLSSIVAPSDGTVLRRFADEHEVVAAGQPVLEISNADSGTVLRAAVSDRDLLRLRRGDSARVVLDAAPDEPLAGQVTELSGAADPATGLFPVVIKLAPTKLALASGMVATVQIAAAGSAQLVHIPMSALVAANGSKGEVFVLEGDVARRREVQIAFIDDADVALAGGLEAGTVVITDGSSYLGDNTRVSVARSSAPAP